MLHEYDKMTLTDKAKLFLASIASDLDTKSADNPSQYFLMGRTLFDKNAFNKINDHEHEPLHGFSVTYGPFDTKAAAEEFVSEYPDDKWPGAYDWVLIRPGKAHVLTHDTEPAETSVVQNNSLQFQAQWYANNMIRRQEEIKASKIKPDTHDPTVTITESEQ